MRVSDFKAESIVAAVQYIILEFNEFKQRPVVQEVVRRYV